MSFKFRRRGDVSEQSPQQEPFFQNAAGQQQPFDTTMYPQMGQPQGYDPNFNAGYAPQHPYFQQPQSGPGPQSHGNQQPAQPFFQNYEENFYTPQQIQAMQSMAQRHPQQPMLNHAPNQPYGMPNPQMPQQQGPSAYMHPVQASQMGNFQGYPSPQGGQASYPSYAPEDVRALNFWRETQANSGFEEPETEQESNSPIRLLVAVAGVALIAGLSWFAYKWAKSPSSDTPPLIHAEVGPHKVHPDHRGGINIPYQDKLIYDRISDGNNAEPAERLLPPPEAPSMNTQAQPPMDQNQQQNQQMVQQPMYNAPGYLPDNTMQNGQVQGGMHPAQMQNMQQQPMVGQPMPAQQMPMNVQPQQQVAVPMPAPVVAPATQSQANEPEVIAKPEATLKGSYFVQIATVKSEAAALKEWKRFQAKYNLKGMKSQIKESETTDGEIVYRLLMGPFEEKVKAMKHAVKMDGAKVVHITE